MTHKRIERLWREAGRAVRHTLHKRRRLGGRENGSGRLKSSAPDAVWRATPSSAAPRTAGG